MAMTPIADLTVLLTVYRRNNWKAQLKALDEQTLRPKRVVVFQNEAHQRVGRRYLAKKGVDYVYNSSNTGYFGRFAHLLTATTDYVAVLDDDIIPGKRCLENYFQQATELTAIIGGNGRIARTNPFLSQLEQPPDVGVRPDPVLVDFVGHMWLFETRLLHDMFSVTPHTFSTGEDMHLCFSAKLRSGVPSFVAGQGTLEESCDVRMNKLASDDFASYRTTPKTDRENVERYFSGLGLSFISPAEQAN